MEEGLEEERRVVREEELEETGTRRALGRVTVEDKKKLLTICWLS